MFKTANRDQLVRNEELSAMKRELSIYISDDSASIFSNTHIHSIMNREGASKAAFPDMLGQTG